MPHPFVKPLSQSIFHPIVENGTPVEMVLHADHHSNCFMLWARIAAVNSVRLLTVPPLSLKPDASFFKKIALGAVGARRVSEHLHAHGHEMVELERGSTETKLWKDVKRKRVRIPDLVCRICGLRVECRAKSRTELSMSHSHSQAERAWDYGMVARDVIAFPVCEPVHETELTSGKLIGEYSYWRGRNWVQWQATAHVNYFEVDSLRANLHSAQRTKGTEEASETFLTWDAVFSTFEGTVSNVRDARITLTRDEGRRYTWRNAKGLPIRVALEQRVQEKEIIASHLVPLTQDQLRCPGRMAADLVPRLLTSVERTQRFTGVKLSRLLSQRESAGQIAALLANQEEDIYIKLECATYSVSVAQMNGRDVFQPYLDNQDDQIRLEAVIALAECASEDVVTVLSEALSDENRPYFLRSAAAWGLGRIGSEAATRSLMRSFVALPLSIREEALEGMASIGNHAVPILLNGLVEHDENVAAGCAETLRRKGLDDESLRTLVGQLSVAPHQWAVWLAGHLPRERVAPHIAELQQQAPQLHYAITLLWMFVESWVARAWELRPNPGPPPER